MATPISATPISATPTPISATPISATPIPATPISATPTSATPTSATSTQNYHIISSFLFNPIAIIILVLLVAACFILTSGSNSGSTSGSNSMSSGTSSALMIILVILVIVIILNVLQYCFNINIIKFINDLFTPIVPKIEDIHIKYPDISFHNIGKQVFNVPGNTYTYEDGKAICKAYGGDLATYEQIEDAYNNGGEWCNYGWSDKQMALFPTQQNTFNNLQKIKGHEHDCGRPGINGGYIANPDIKFGVNCYGNKPKINSNEEALMKTMTPYPETKQDLEFQQKVDYWKNKANEILLSPFNYNSWEEI
jgi:hypothetical protein